MIRPAALAILVFASVAVAACVPDGPRPDHRSGSYVRLLEAEDARPAADSPLETPIFGTDAEDPRLRRVAVRALGRLESPELAPQIAPHLADADPPVRAAAALAQSVHGADGTGVLEFLLARASEEEHALVRGSLARSIGRLALDAPGRLRASDAIVALGDIEDEASTTETLVGVALGFDAFVRGATDEGHSGEAAGRLEVLATLGSDQADAVEAARIRALALSSLGRTRRLTVEHIERALADPDPDVRRAVLGHLNAVVPSRREDLLTVALEDPSARVAIDALRILACGSRDGEVCGRLLEAAAAPAPPALRLVALEALARPCPGEREQSTLLTGTASELPAESDELWQPAARALDTSALTTVYILDDEARETSGRFLRLEPDAVVILVGDAERRFEVGHVRRIQKRGDPLKNGVLIGVATGAAFGALGAAMSDCAGGNPDGPCSDTGGRAAAAVVVFGMFVAMGAGIDALIPGRTTVFEAAGGLSRLAPSLSIAGNREFRFDLAFRW